MKKYIYPIACIVLTGLTLWRNSTTDDLAIVWTFLFIPVALPIMLYGVACLLVNGAIVNLLDRYQSVAYAFSGGIYLIVALSMPSWHGHLEDVSKTRGDKILVEMKSYQEQHGSCPTQLSDMVKVENNYKPTIIGSEFEISASAGICYIRFASDNFWDCRNNTAVNEWYCSD